MPVVVGAPLQRLSEEEFGRIAYDVLGCVFDIHREFGRFFDEKIYERELARRMPSIELEVPVEVAFDCFKKTYFLDVLAHRGAVFELKTADTLVSRHRSQLLNYLLMCDLAHGKLINVRTEQVQHEFVNTTLRPADRKQFTVHDGDWADMGASTLRDWTAALVRDLGTCLDFSLYEEAITEFLGGEQRVIQQVPILSGGQVLGAQRFRLLEPDVAIKITTLNNDLANFEQHAQRLLSHTNLNAIQWININRHELRFKTIHRI